MAVLLSLLLAAGASDLASQFQREWQTCVIDTSKLWAGKPGPPENIADAATVYCQKKLDLFVIAQTDKAKEMGLNSAQADEYVAFLVGSLLRMNRSFAVEAVSKARAK